MTMRRSDAYLPTMREGGNVERDDVRLAVRAGLIRRFGSGLYGFTPAGERVRQNIIDVVETELRAVGAQRVSLPQLNYRDIWDASGRWGSFEGEMLTLENRDGIDMCLAPSHEEGIVHLVDGHVQSYDDLPLVLYQVDSKHRDDHARNGLLRTKEFTMIDAYSLHATERDLVATYDAIHEAYERIFDAIGLDVAICDADNTVMGGSTSEEFVAPVTDGTCGLVACTTDTCRFGVTDEHDDYDEYADSIDSDDADDADDRIGDCPDCGGRLRSTDGVEVGHVFHLGTRYADAMDLTVHTESGDDNAVQMASYGIGVTRIVQTLLTQHGTDDGCNWPVTSSDCNGHDAGTDSTWHSTEASTVAPYEVAIVPLVYEADADIRRTADRVHETLQRAGVDVLLFDDADQSIGERFAETDLLGIPTRVVLGTHYTETGEIEIESSDGGTRYRAFDAAIDELTANSGAAGGG